MHARGAGGERREHAFIHLEAVLGASPARFPPPPPPLVQAWFWIPRKIPQKVPRTPPGGTPK
jgi:hypothetical protein